MKKRGPAPLRHSHAKPAKRKAHAAPAPGSVARGTYPAFIDELFRLGLIDGTQRATLRKAVPAAPEETPRPEVAKPSSAGFRGGDAAAARAVKAGLVEDQGRGRYLVRCGPETVHWGYLWGAADPVLRVAPGAIVTIDTVSHEGLLEDQGAPQDFFPRFGIPRAKVLKDAIEIYAKVQHSGAGPHIVSGPVYVEGAEPGDVLAVHVLKAKPRVPYGVNTCRTGKGSLPDEFTLNRSVVIPFDEQRGVAKFAPGIEVPLRPFFGIMATGPARNMGKLSSVPPGAYGGNIDLKDLTEGSTFYIPVHVPGALFMVGDGHAAQGDGEVNLTAIETSMTGTFRLDLLKQKFWSLPRAETPTHWIAVGLHEDLNEAMRIAVRETIKFLTSEHGLSPADAYALASIAIDFEVTQVVDAVKGIHAMIPKALFTR